MSVSNLSVSSARGAAAAGVGHPLDELAPGQLLGRGHYGVHYSGGEGHASAAPWEGVNAQDALTIAQVAIGLLRQQLPPGDQVHGVVTKSSSAAHIIPP